MAGAGAVGHREATGWAGGDPRTGSVFGQRRIGSSERASLETLLLVGLALVGLAVLLPTDFIGPRQARPLLLGMLILGALGVIGGIVATGPHLAEIAKDSLCLTVQAVVQVFTLLTVKAPCLIRAQAYLGIRVLQVALGLLLFGALRLVVREMRGRQRGERGRD
jgi:hypothetical protein